MLEFKAHSMFTKQMFQKTDRCAYCYENETTGIKAHRQNTDYYKFHKEITSPAKNPQAKGRKLQM